MKKVYHLSHCGTCKKIIAAHKLSEGGFILQDIKTDRIKAEQLDEMKKMAGSYEVLFSRRAIKYRSLGLSEKNLSEQDYRSYILEDYTFLKRPVIIDGDRIYVGSEKRTMDELNFLL
jgi:arsenate reductase